MFAIAFSFKVFRYLLSLPVLATDATSKIRKDSKENRYFKCSSFRQISVFAKNVSFDSAVFWPLI